jgi:hypothetical protein
MQFVSSGDVLSVTVPDLRMSILLCDILLKEALVCTVQSFTVFWAYDLCSVTRQDLLHVKAQTGSGAPQPPIHWVQAFLPRWAKRPGRVADHSPTAEVRNEWRYTSTPHYVPSCLV